MQQDARPVVLGSFVPSLGKVDHRRCKPMSHPGWGNGPPFGSISPRLCRNYPAPPPERTRTQVYEATLTYRPAISYQPYHRKYWLWVAATEHNPINSRQSCREVKGVSVPNDPNATERSKQRKTCRQKLRLKSIWKWRKITRNQELRTKLTIYITSLGTNQHKST